MYLLFAICPLLRSINLGPQYHSLSRITDEAAIEGHDLIHQAELEEERKSHTLTVSQSIDA